MGGGWVAVDVDYAGCATVPLCHCASLCPLDTKPKKERETRDTDDNWSSRDQTVFDNGIILPQPLRESSCQESRLGLVTTGLSS